MRKRLIAKIALLSLVGGSLGPLAIAGCGGDDAQAPGGDDGGVLSQLDAATDGAGSSDGAMPTDASRSRDSSAPSDASPPSDAGPPACVSPCFQGLASPVTAISAGTGGAILAALTAAGTVYSEGLACTAASRLAYPQLTGAQAIAAGDEHVCGLMPGGVMTCVGPNGAWAGTSLPPNHDVLAITLDLSAYTTSPVVEIAAGGAASCALTQDHRLFCMGSDNFIAGPGLTPLATAHEYEWTNGFASTIAHVTTSGEHVCVTLADGSASCFGNDSLGQLGNGTSQFLYDDAGGLDVDPSYHNATVATLVPIASAATRVVTGYLQTCALESGGAVECWGDDKNGELGDKGALQLSRVPVAIPFGSAAVGPVAQLTADSTFECVLGAAGATICWGKTGTGSIEAAALVDMNGHHASQLALTSRVCALLETKDVCCY